jgi:carboxyl-terminal processing protease
LKGVMPDLMLPDVLNYSTQFGESSLENPLPWDTIPSANYSTLNMVQPYLDELRRRSAERIATNQDFIYTRQDIEQFQKMQADKTASLNEHERLKERQEADGRQKARDQERAARKAPDVKIYELTVAKAGDPGLPPPLGETNTVTANELPAGPLPTPVGSANVTTAPPPPTPPAVDPMLDETERILEDYISLLSSNQVLIAK